MDITKTLFATIFTVILTAGCASVTDANLDTNDMVAIDQVTTTQSNDTWDSTSGDDMDPIIAEPNTNE